MYYAIENADGTYNRRVSEYENVIWDENNYCTVPALTDEKRAMFHIFPFQMTTPPDFPRWHSYREIAPIKQDGVWIQQWEVYDLGMSLDEKKAEITSSAVSNAITAFNNVVYGGDQYLMQFYQYLTPELRLYASTKKPEDAHILSSAAQIRGITLDALVAECTSSFASVNTAAGTCIGKVGKIKDAVAVAADDAALLAIDIDTGWPTV